MELKKGGVKIKIKVGMLALIMVLTIISAGTAFSEPVAAASHDVNSSMNNAEIQSIIDSADLGDTVNFLAGIYNSVALTITNALNLISNGAILNSNAGNTVLTITGANSAGTNITGFTINGNGSTYGVSALNTAGLNIGNNTFNNTQRAISFSNVNESSIASNKINNNTNYGIFISNTGNLTSRNNVLIDGNTLLNSAGGFNLAGSGYTVTNNYVSMNGSNGGVYGKNLYSVLVENNTFLKGKDGINVFQNYRNFTVNNNTIINMTRDGISFVNDNPANIETVTSTSITNNVVSGKQEYGLFLGGNFQGNVVDNVIGGSTIAGVNITGKSTSSLGLLNANITGNDITNTSGIGVAMESPNVQYLNFSDNVIDSTSYSIQYNQYFRDNGVMIEENNSLSSPQNFMVNSSMTNDYIQSLIDGANLGDTVTFLSGVYSNISLTITSALNLVSSGAILNSNAGSTVLTITGANSAGTNITGFTINGNGSTYGVSASGTTGLNIVNNTFNNTKRAVYFSNVNESSIQSNGINNNTEYGIYISDSGNLTSRNNVLINGNQLINSSGGFNLVGSGFAIVNNYVDMKGGSNGGVNGKDLYSVLVQNNTFLNGKDGINVFQNYRNFTVVNNSIINMSRDGISFANHNPANIETVTSTVISNNIVQGNQYGLFLGGNFQGNVTDNVFDSSSIMGMEIAGKSQPTMGLLYANITGNNITNGTAIGFGMEHPSVQYLNFSDNIIDSDGYSIQYNQYFRNNGVMVEENNSLSSPQNFMVNSSMTNDYIQSRIDGANLGDTVTFLSGVYNNIALSITKAVNLVSNGAILKNNGTSPIISVTGTNATGTSITGFTINGTGQGISLDSVANVTIYNDTMAGNTVAIAFNNATNNTVSNLQFVNNGAAVQIYKSNSNNILNSNFTGNDYGVYLSEGNNNNIGNNQFNVTNPNGRALYLESGQGNQIADNVISGGVYGIESLNDYQNIYNGNIISSAVWRDMYLVNAVQNIISDNQLTQAINGLLLEGGSQNQVIENTLSNCGSGLEIINSNNNSMIANNLTQNTFGVYLYGDSGNNITLNNVSSCGSGVELHESSQNNIKDNDLSQNTFGTYIAGGSENTVEENNINNTSYGGAGVRLENTTDNVINNNTISSDSKDFRYGVYVEQGSNNTISNNYAGNNHAGVELHDTNSNNVSSNYLNNNTMGVFTENTSENTFSANAITNNGAGVEMHDSSGNIFSGHYIANNTFGMILFNSNNNNITSSMFDNNGAAVNLQTSSYNTVDITQMNNNSYGVYIFGGDHNLVQNSQMTNLKLDGSGVFLDNTTLNTVTNNVFNNTEKIFTYGIYENGGSANVLESNFATGTHAGIELHDTSSNTIEYNCLTDNILGLFMWGGSSNVINSNQFWGNGAGIEIHQSKQNNLTWNSLISNTYGFYLDNLTNSNITDNLLSSNVVGLYSDNSNDNQIYRINFISSPAYDNGSNSYDNGTIGNYWSDYSGSGVYYVPGGSNVDHYPQTTPFQWGA